MRRKIASEPPRVESTPPKGPAGHSWSESETPAHMRRQEAQPQRQRADPSDRRAGRACSVSSPARGGGKEDAECEQRAGCARHSLDFQHSSGGSTPARGGGTMGYGWQRAASRLLRRPPPQLQTCCPSCLLTSVAVAPANCWLKPEPEPAPIQAEPSRIWSSHHFSWLPLSQLTAC